MEPQCNSSGRFAAERI